MSDAESLSGQSRSRSGSNISTSRHESGSSDEEPDHSRERTPTLLLNGSDLPSLGPDINMKSHEADHNKEVTKRGTMDCNSIVGNNHGEETAALHIQSMYRGRRARAEVEALKSCRCKEEQQAARQRHSAPAPHAAGQRDSRQVQQAAGPRDSAQEQETAFCTQSVVTEEQQAALYIQRVHRGQLARARVQLLQEERKAAALKPYFRLSNEVRSCLSVGQRCGNKLPGSRCALRAKLRSNGYPQSHFFRSAAHSSCGDVKNAAKKVRSQRRPQSRCQSQVRCSEQHPWPMVDPWVDQLRRAKAPVQRKAEPPDESWRHTTCQIRRCSNRRPALPNEARGVAKQGRQETDVFQPEPRVVTLLEDDKRAKKPFRPPLTDPLVKSHRTVQVTDCPVVDGRELSVPWTLPLGSPRRLWEAQQLQAALAEVEAKVVEAESAAARWRREVHYLAATFCSRGVDELSPDFQSTPSAASCVSTAVASTNSAHAYFEEKKRTFMELATSIEHECSASRGMSPMAGPSDGSYACFEADDEMTFAGLRGRTIEAMKVCVAEHQELAGRLASLQFKPDTKQLVGISIGPSSPMPPAGRPPNPCRRLVRFSQSA